MNDILIVGAGVAGLSTALLLNEKGFKIKVIEKNADIGMHSNTKIDVTESSGIESFFKKQKIKYNYSNVSVWHSLNETVKIKSKVKDFFIVRGKNPLSIEMQLKEKALDKGIEFVFNQKIRDVISEKKEVKVKSQKHEFKGSILVGADGFNSNIREMTGFKLKKFRVFEGYGFTAKKLNLKDNETNIYFDSRFMPGGYFYAVNAYNNLAAASIVTVNNKTPIIKENLEHLTRKNTKIKDLLNNVKPSSFFYGKSFAGELNTLTKDKILLVGDAALTLSPLFGYGVNPAIRSALAAAKAIEMNIEEKKSLSGYDKMIEKEGLKISLTDKMLAKIFSRLSNNEFDFIIENLKKMTKKNSIDELLEIKSLLLKKVSITALRHPIIVAKILCKALI